MSRPDLFLDSSALFAGVVSPSGAARALLLLVEAGRITVSVSEQVITETERAVARKVPRALPYYREALRNTQQLQIVHDPSLEEIETCRGIIAHEADLPIVVAAMMPIVVVAMGARVDYLVTLNRRHFIDDPRVADRSGLRIGTPGDALAWVRELLTQEPE